MATDVWLKHDIANALLGVANAQVQGARLFGGGSREAQLYLAGVRDVVASLALSFGISPVMVIPDELWLKEDDD